MYHNFYRNVGKRSYNRDLQKHQNFFRLTGTIAQKVNVLLEITSKGQAANKVVGGKLLTDQL